MAPALPMKGTTVRAQGHSHKPRSNQVRSVRGWQRNPGTNHGHWQLGRSRTHRGHWDRAGRKKDGGAFLRFSGGKVAGCRN